jgi:hypothetical protein
VSGETRSLEKEERMSSKRTFSGALGLVFLAAALWSGSAMAAGPTPAAVNADGLRWQAMADFYKHRQSPTPAGIKADGLRWQAIARFYGQRQSPTPAGIKADGLRWRAIARFYEQQQRPTPEAIRADGLRWQAIARAYGVHTVTTPSQSSSGSGFDFGAAGIGALAALGLAVIASALMVIARRIRRTKLAV